MTAADIVSRMLSDGSLDLPAPGGGRTRERHMRLFDIARHQPVSVARLVEAHTDAIAILAEAGRQPQPGALYGVWASSGPSNDVRIRPRSPDDMVGASTDLVVAGTKPFASGLGHVTRALVTATPDTANTPPDARAAPTLVDVDVDDAPTLTVDTDRWATSALAEASTGSITFDDHGVASSDIIGPPGWYLDRVGFWHGACGPAACWAGAAAGLVDAAEHLVDDNAHRRAHLGGLRSDLWALVAVLTQAGEEIDAHPHDADAAHRRALAVRHHVERVVADVLDRFGRAFGPRPFAHDAELNQRWVDTHLYTRQDHAERDLEVLGRLTSPGNST